jgi:outer membrane cobalamin receptor
MSCVTDKKASRRLARTCRLALWLLAASPAWSAAQPNPDLAEATLDDLMKVTVTTASRRAEGLSEAPALIEVVTARQIRARGYRSLGDLLRDQLGIKVDIGGDADYPSQLTVMGTRATSRVVLLLDGIRVASPTGEPLPILANYPVHTARQVEILYGPASALYGADAFSAVINVITKGAADAEGLSVGSTIGQFGLFNETASYGRSFGRNASMLVSGQWLRDAQPDLSRAYPAIFEGMQAQRTGVFNTIYGPMTSSQPVSAEYEAPIAAHSAHALLRGGGFQMSVFQNSLRTSTSRSISPDNTVYNRSAYQQNDLWVGAGSYTASIGRLTTTSTVTMSRHELAPDSGYWNVYSNLERSFKYAFGSMIKVEEQVSWTPVTRTMVTAGATYERFYASPQGADLNEPIESRDHPGTILATGIVDAFVKVRYANSGGYVQVQHAPAPQLSLTAGARADYNTRYGGTFNPRIGVVWHPARGTTVKTLFGTAYLTPSPYQAYSHFGSFYTTDGGATYASDYWHLGNAGLKPQHRATLQGSLSQALGPIWNITASAFRSRSTDVIKGFDPETGGPGTYLGWPVAYIDTPVNEGDETIYGGTVDVDFLKSWSERLRVAARMGVSLADGRVRDGSLPDGGLELGAIAPMQVRLSTDVNWAEWTGSARLMAFGRQRLVATVETADDIVRRTLPGYRTLDLSLRRNRVTRHLDVFLNVENAFDVRYFHINERAYSDATELLGAPQGPRRIMAGIDFRFGQR